MSSRREHDLPESTARYFSRGTQLQALVLLGTVAAVFAIAHEATRPFWSQWGLAEPLPPPLTAAQIETLQTPVSENRLADNWTLSPDRLRRLVPADDLQGVDAEIDRRWRNVIDDLTPARTFELLGVLLVATNERPAASSEPAATPDENSGDRDDPSDRAAPPVELSPETLAAVEAGWKRERADLADMLIGAGDREATDESRRLIETVRSRVAEQLAAFDGTRSESANFAEDDPRLDLTPDERAAALLPVLRAWDGAALNAVVDATANGDPGDFALWYRLFDRLGHVSDESLHQAADGRVAAASLAHQPHAHRGELFELVGTARGGKSVKAQPNVLGIRRYYVIWVQPDDDRDALVAVYSLSKPEGFPDLPEQSEVVRFAYRVEAPVYFLKKMAYEAQNSISVSPLVLARSFRFEPSQPVAASEPPSVAALSIGIGFAAVAGIGFVSYIVLKTRRGAGDTEALPARIDETELRKRFVESP